MFSPDHADPGSRRLAALLPGSLAGRVAGRVADLGAGWGWLAGTALDRLPGIAELDLYEAEAWRSTPPAPTSPTRAPASTGPTTKNT